MSVAFSRPNCHLFYSVELVALGTKTPSRLIQAPEVTEIWWTLLTRQHDVNHVHITGPLWGESTGPLWGESTGPLWGESTGPLWGESTGPLWGESTGPLWGESTGPLWGESTGPLWGESTGPLWGESTGPLWGESTGPLWGESTGPLWGDVSPVDSPHKRSLMQSIDITFVVSLNKLSNKQPS